METQLDKYNEKQKKRKYLAFLLHLYKLLPNDKFVPFNIEDETEKFSISKVTLSSIIKEKVIASEQSEEQTLYRWNSIHPNVFMVERLIKSEQTNKTEQEETKPKIETQERNKPHKQPTQIITTEITNELQQPVNEKLRPYQEDGIRKIFEKWKGEKQSVLFQMPTGTGKTVLFNRIVEMGFNKQRKILIVVHRRELIEQITKKLNGKGIKVGHIVAGKTSDYSKIVQVASIQTLTRREFPEANLVIIDECHHSKATTYKKLWEMYPDAKFLGVTATPYRLSGEGFDDLFDDIIVSMSVNDFIKNKYLVPITHYACSTPDLSGVKTRQGDYVTNMLSGIMSENSIMKDVVESYKEKCSDKTAIVFAVDVEHSKEIAQRFKDEGIAAEHIDAKTPKDEREQILNDFKSKKIKVVSNVEIITEGFDFPECEAIILARPTKSLSLYLQMVGRVMRPAEGKTEGIVLDNAGLWKEHQLSTIDRTWTLEGAPKKRKKEYIPNTEIAMDEDGILTRVERERPNEVKGLKLIPLTFELESLLVFESYVSNAKHNEHKLISAYYRYRDGAEMEGRKLSKEEFEYCKNSLKYHSTKVRPDLAVKSGVWYYEEQKLKNPIAEQRQDILMEAMNKVTIKPETNWD